MLCVCVCVCVCVYVQVAMMSAEELVELDAPGLIDHDTERVVANVKSTQVATRQALQVHHLSILFTPTNFHPCVTVSALAFSCAKPFLLHKRGVVKKM